MASDEHRGRRSPLSPTQEALLIFAVGLALCLLLAAWMVLFP